MLADLSPSRPEQGHLFEESDPKALMRAVDRVNQKMGSGAVRFGNVRSASGGGRQEAKPKDWQMQRARGWT